MAQGRSRPAARMGTRRPPVRHADHLVPGGRGPLHRIHLRGGSGARLRGRRDRVLRGPLHHPGLPDPVRGVPAAVARVAQARLHHARRFRARALRQSVAGAGGHDHRHRGDHAVHRAAARRPAGGDRRARHFRQGHDGGYPLIIAFLILAAFTYSSGLRAPAAIAIVKDTLIFVTVFAAIIVIPIELGGYSQIFAAVPAQKLLLAAPQGHTTGAYSNYATLALGSALALFLYPHSITAILSASSGRAIRRNAALLPAYSLLLGLLALLGFMAIAAGVDKLPEYAGGFRQFKANFAVPALMLYAFPSWFAGVALAAIGIGAIVPAAIMSIAAANLFTRNVYREFWGPDCTSLEESQMAKWVSLVVKAGALVFILALPPQYAIQLQLLGGIWIIQTLPPVILGLYTRWLDPWALLIGWAAGIGVGSAIAVKYSFTSIWPVVIAGFSFPGYTALYTLVLNLLIAVALTPVFKAIKGHAKDETVPADYHA